MARLAGAAVTLCALLAGCGGSGGFAGAMRRCVGERQMSPVRSTDDLAFALQDVRRGRVETDDGSGRMRSGDETDWTVHEPFAIAVRHPERFGGLGSLAGRTHAKSCAGSTPASATRS